MSEDERVQLKKSSFVLELAVQGDRDGRARKELGSEKKTSCMI
jgi:hypothetical protein